MANDIPSSRKVQPALDAGTQALVRSPRIAWRSVALFFFLYSVIALASTAALTGRIPLWAGMLINGIAAYAMFSVAHDSIHRSVVGYSRVNEVVGNLAFFVLVPFVSVAAGRWVHMEHHKHANQRGQDPDEWVHGGLVATRPLRWMFFDAYYGWYALKHPEGRVMLKREWPSVAVMLISTATMLVVPTIFGYGWEMVMLWLLPTRLGVMGNGFSFIWLPHQPYEVSQHEDLYKATTIRSGLYWLMTPVLAYQNYHLVHHLFPGSPFHNNGKIWRAIKHDVAAQHDLVIQDGLAIRPRLRPAGSDQPI